MRKYFLLLSIFILLFEAHAEEAFFRPVERQLIQLSEGDSFKGVLELWNIKNISPEMIYELEEKTFLDSFFVVKLDKPKWSENNPEVVVIEGLFILEKKIEGTEKKWALGGLEIDVKIKEFETSVFKDRKTGFIVLDGNYKINEENKYIMPIIFISLILVLALLAFVMRKRKKTNGAVKREEINWPQLFISAKTVEDFSRIYEDRYIWRSEFDESFLDNADFLKDAEEILYKKEIQDFEIEQLKISVEKLAKGFRG